MESTKQRTTGTKLKSEARGVLKVLPSAGRRLPYKYLSLLILIMIFILNGCDSGLKIKEIEIAQLPYKTVYVCNVDNELNIKGGKIYVITADGHKNIENLSSREIKIMHNIDFACKGEYDVFVYLGDSMCNFSVAVE